MFEKPNINHKKDRRVRPSGDREIPVGSVEVTPGSISESDLHALINDASGVRDKAQRLANAIAANPNKRYMPVVEEATAVRKAVANLDPSEPNGERISYELYLSEIEKATTPITKDQIADFVGSLTGIPSIDSVRTKVVESGDMGDEENSYMLNSAMHAALLYLLGQLMAGHTANESAKQGGETVSTGVTSSWAVAFAMLYMQHAGGDKKIAEFMSEFMGGDKKTSMGTANDLMDAFAEGNATPDSFMKEVEEYDAGKAADVQRNMVQSKDYAAIREYVSQMKAENSSYADWDLGTDAVDTVKEMDRTIGELTEWGDTTKAAAGLPVDLYKVTKCNVDGSNLNLDMTASLLSSHYAADLVCCLVRWLGSDGFSTDALKTMRSLLKFAANGMTVDLKKINKALQDNYRKKIEKLVLEPIIHSIRRVFKKWTKEITEWIDPKSHVDEGADERTQKKQMENWKQLFTCTPIDEMLRHLIVALRKMEKFIIKLIKMLWASTKTKNKGWRLKLETLGDKKSIDSQIKVLDAVIKAIEKGKLCDVKDTKYPGEDTVRELARGILNDTPPMLPLDAPEGKEDDPYWRYNPVAFDTPSGLRIASWETSAGQERDVSKVTAKDCIKGLTDENVIPYPVDPSHTEVTRNVRELREGLGKGFFGS